MFKKLISLKIIFFFGEGRLGNQLFQYHFIKSIANNDYIIISRNFEDMLALFDSITNIINIQNRILKFLIRQLALPVLDFFARTRLISSYKIDSYNENGFIVPDISYSKNKGLLPIIYIYPCYFQSEIFFKQDLKNLIIKKIYLEKAQQFLTLIANDYKKVFVHVRRGDYIHFSVLGKIGVTLPMSYYRNRIQWYEENIENPFFVFLTDDPEFVEYCFENIHNKIISQNSMFVDFAIMTLCEYGIMSNSSFSWWAAYMVKNRIKVFSPKYWLGWKSKVEYHKGISPSFAEIVEVEK
jgi:hypothetical protein